MRIALVQQHVTDDRDETLGRLLTCMEHAAEMGADLVAFPELARERFFPQDPDFPGAPELAEPIPGPTTERLSELAAELSLVVVYNMYEVADGGRTFDSSPVLDADGSLLGVTRMVHITDFEGFHERAYYEPGDRGAPVYDTAAGRVGVAICYDRHYPEYMRALGVAGAEVAVIPQAGVADEWPEGMYEAEVRTAAFQNGYYAALCNRVGVDGDLIFAGESFVVDPEGQLTARGKRLVDDIVTADLDPEACRQSTARKLFWRDRRPELYGPWLRAAGDGSGDGG